MDDVRRVQGLRATASWLVLGSRVTAFVMLEDDVPPLIAAAADHLIAGDPLAAEATLLRLDRHALVSARKLAMNEVWSPEARRRFAPVRTVPVRRVAVSGRVAEAAFRRDHFTCRYCGRRTIHLDVLKLLSRALPRALPYDPGWKPVEDLIVFWTHSVSIEHHVPLARGGSNDSSNIVTSCYQCNDVKKYYLAEELGWSLRPAKHSEWDGLVSRLPALRLRIGSTRVAGRPAPPDTLSQIAAPSRSSSHHEKGRNTAILDVNCPAPVRAGSLIRARLPGKNSRRSYRVEFVAGQTVGMREMWREGPHRLWVASKAVTHVPVQELEGIELVVDTAPSCGRNDVP